MLNVKVLVAPITVVAVVIDDANTVVASLVKQSELFIYL
jgi:hypothetical protein